jgi:hypothetical protein
LSSCQCVKKPHDDWNTDRLVELVAAHPSPVTMLIIILIFLSILTLLNYSTCRDVGYPPFLMSALWLLVMTLYCLAPIPIYAISHVSLLEEKMVRCSRRALAHSSHGTTRIGTVFCEALNGRYARFSNSWQSVIEDLCF